MIRVVGKETPVHYAFISAHCIQGVVHAAHEPDLVLFDDQSQGICVVLTARPNEHLQLLSRHLALLSMTIRDPLPVDFSDRLTEEIAKIERQRLDAVGADAVVVVRLSGEIDAVVPNNARAIQDFVLCFVAYDKKALRDQLQPKVSAVLTAVRIGARGQYEFRLLAEGSYLISVNAQVIHSAQFEAGSLGVHVSSRLTDAQRAQVGADLPLVLKAGDLERVIGLHAHSLNTATDNYRSFIASWSALEILIGKLFPAYQRLLATELRAVSQAPGLHAYLDRVADVMGAKHSLADKFSVLSVYLSDKEGAEDLVAFRALKNIRNRLTHGEDMAEANLPTRAVQSLFERCLRNHLRRDA